MKKRGYDMTARAEAAAATGERILDAAIALFWEQPTDQIVLADVAERAGVSVQTVLRRHGSREGLFAAAGARAVEGVTAQRDTARVGDLEDIVRVLLDHYEDIGRGVLRMIAAEDSSPALAEIVAGGRAFHRLWCERCFAPFLTGLAPAVHSRRLAQVVALCDISLWKVLRIDSRLTREDVHTALIEMLGALLAPTSSSVET